jgi:predicted PolB exonuclease-like 3'-5' exonuclease
LNTYLVYLRFELMRGNIDRTQYNTEQQRVREWLQAADKPHFEEFLAAWPEQRL